MDNLIPIVWACEEKCTLILTKIATTSDEKKARSVLPGSHYKFIFIYLWMQACSHLKVEATSCLQEEVKTSLYLSSLDVLQTK